MKWFLAIIIGLIVFYRDSFFSRFFQDDFLLFELSKRNDIFTPIPNFPYRPVAVQIFYSLGRFISGVNPFGFHLLAFFLIIGALFFVHQVALKILKDETGAKLATLFYAFNISLFPLFFWVAASYFVLAAFFTFGTIHLVFEKKPWATVFFILGLLSNEIVLVTVGLLFLIRNIPWKKLITTVVVSVIYLISRLQLAFPTAFDYRLDFSPVKFLATFRWYFLRIFNLPEGVRIGGSPLIYVLFFTILTFFAVASFRAKISWRLALFSIAWFFIGALPFFFLPNHMSSYYLTLSLFGPAVLVGKVFAGQKKLMLLFFGCYLLLAILGLNFLSQTHWIILKPTR